MRYLLFLNLLILLSCSNTETSTLFEPQQSLGSISSEVKEASGLAVSVTNPGHLWTHNDGNNPARVFLINEKAEIVMTCKLKDVWNRDWEDITMGPGPEAGVPYVYVADIGDNDSRFRFKILYRFKEPAVEDGKIEIENIDKLVIRVPNGPRDTEAIMVDPLTSNFYLISKRERSVRLYEIKYPFASDTLQAEVIGTLPFTNIVAADISPDGSEVLLKSYRDIYYWKRKENESIQEVLLRKPALLNYEMEPQGESIAWKLDGSGFYTLSESKVIIGGNLYFYKRKQN